MVRKISYFDLSVKFVIVLSIINALSSIFYFGEVPFFAILSGKLMPLIMNLPLYIYIIINIKEFKLNAYSFFDIVCIIYILFLMLNFFYGIIIGNSLYEALADLFRYMVIALVYIYAKNFNNLNNSTLKLYKYTIIFIQFLTFIIFIYMILSVGFTRYALSLEFLMVYFVFYDDKIKIPLKVFFYSFIIISIALTYTRSGLIMNSLMFIYFMFFFKRNKVNYKNLLSLFTVIVLVIIIFANIPLLNNYYNLVKERLLGTFQSIKNLFRNEVRSYTSYNDTLEERALEAYYSNIKIDSMNTPLIYLVGAGLGSEYVDYSKVETGVIHFGPQRDLFKTGYIGLILSNLMYIMFIVKFFLKRKIHRNYELLFIYFLIQYFYYFSFWNFFSFSHLIVILVFLSNIVTDSPLYQNKGNLF